MQRDGGLVMRDLEKPGLMKLKAALFLLCGGLSSALLLLEKPTLKVALLLSIAVWCFCRLYYFAFYVIEHYLDADYRYSGLWSAMRHLVSKQR
jgi:hypothetical protein